MPLGLLAVGTSGAWQGLDADVQLCAAITARTGVPASTSTLALVLLVAGSAVREGAPLGESVPALAVNTIVMSLICYAVPALMWVLQPVRLRPSGVGRTTLEPQA